MDPCGSGILHHGITGDDRMLLLAVSTPKTSARWVWGHFPHPNHIMAHYELKLCIICYTWNIWIEHVSTLIWHFMRHPRYGCNAFCPKHKGIFYLTCSTDDGINGNNGTPQGLSHIVWFEFRYFLMFLNYAFFYTFKYSITYEILTSNYNILHLSLCFPS